MPRSYQKLFKQRAVITNLNGKRLPFRVYFDDLAMFFGSFLMFVVLDFFTPYHILNLVMNRWIVIFGSAAGFTYLARKIDPSEKPLAKYLFDVVAYLLRSHVSDGISRIDRRLIWKHGRRRIIPKIKVNASWTHDNVPIPLKVQSGEFSFKSEAYLDVQMKRQQTVFKKAHRLGFGGKHGVRGLAPGHYQVKDRQIRKVEGS